MTTLNPQQRAAVESEAPLIVCSAGPGAGKSQVLVERIRHRVAAGHDPKRMMAITYTSAGALVMKRRLEGITLSSVSTLHAWCFRLIQDHGHLIGYKRGSVIIIPEADVSPMIMGIAKRLGIKASQQALLAGKYELVTKEYQHTLKRSGAVDFDGILRDGLRLVRLPEVNAALNIDEVYGDEMQDASAIDWCIYDALPGSKFLIGDEDQSIFQWRNAVPGMLSSRAVSAKSEHHILDLNYRSDRLICEGATRLIRNNSDRVDKAVVSTSTEPGTIEFQQFDTDTAELSNVTYQAIGHHQAGSTVAILTRNNAQAEQFRTAVTGYGIKLAEDKPNLPRDWQTALLYVSLALAPDNEMTVEKVLLRHWPQVEVNRMKLCALRDGISLGSRLNIAIAPNLDCMAQYLTSNSISAESVTLTEQRIALLPQPFPTIADLLHDLMSGDWTPKEERQEQRFMVSTVHSAKGTEFDVVFMPGLEQGLFPSARSPESEERCLAFVGMTRARHCLFLSASRSRFAYGKTVTSEVSQFVSEALGNNAGPGLVPQGKTV